jgi:DNA mismatch repair ATPase MutL
MMRAVGLAVAVLLLTSCADTGSSDRPSAGSTRTPASAQSPTATIPEVTRTPERTQTSSRSPESEKTSSTSEPTRSPEREQTSSNSQSTRAPERAESSSPTDTAPEQTRSSEVVAAPSPTASEPTRTESSADETTSPTETTPTDAPSPTASASVQPTSSESDGAPTWLWWVLVVLLVGLAVGIPLLVRASHRREWRDNLTSAEDEVAWFARGLIPQLSQMDSLAQVAGAWNLAEGRVAAVEDRLTALEPTAPDDVAQARVLDLRDAVRAARSQIQALLQAGLQETMTQDLDTIATHLEQVLQPPTTPLD